MIIIEIDNEAVKSKQGTNKEGKPWTMNFQQVLIHGHFVDGFAARHPRETTIQLDENNPKPFPVGKYVVSAESYFFGDFGRFSMGRMKLQPLSQFLAEVQAQFKVQPVAAAAAPAKAA